MRAVGHSHDFTRWAPAVRGSHLLLAVGRLPNTDDLGLYKTGISVDSRGFIPVDDQLRSAVSGIWALGDCNGKGAFTHTSYNDFEVVAGNLLDGQNRSVHDRIHAYALSIEGFMKSLVNAETKQIVGAAVLGVGGDEVIHEILEDSYGGGRTP